MSSMNSTITRRGFVAGAGIAAASTAVCAAATAPAALADGAPVDDGAWTWPAKPEAVADSDIVETIEADVVIVGAGIAGLATAASAAENGLSVVVLEQNEDISARGGHWGSANSTYWKDAGVTQDPAEIAKDWIAQSNSRCDERLVWKFLNNSGAAIDWLGGLVEDAGGIVVLCGMGYQSYPYPEYKGTVAFIPPEGSELSLANMAQHTLFEHAQELGATFSFQQKAEQLVEEDGRIAGVIASGADGLRRYLATVGVVMCTGDISGNEAMCRVLSPLAYRCNASQYTPVGANMGDGQIMGKWVGALIEDAPFAPMIHPQGYSSLQGAQLIVNGRGERFMNEGTWCQGRSLEILNQPGHLGYAWVVFGGDVDAWAQNMYEGLQYGGGMFWDTAGAGFDPETGTTTTTAEYYPSALQKDLDNGIHTWKFDTLDEAAAHMEVDAATLRATVERYNELCEKGVDEDFGKDAHFLYPVAPEGPFYVAKVGPARMVCPGGMVIDPDSRVLNEDREPIPGLYAVGNCSGGLYAVDYPLVICGNSHGRCVTFGHLLGKYLAEQK